VPIAGVGFDLDHTLCVTEPDRASLLAEAAASVDAPAIAEWMSRPAYREAHRANLTSDTRAPVFETLLEETDFEKFADYDDPSLKQHFFRLEKTPSPAGG